MKKLMTKLLIVGLLISINTVSWGTDVSFGSCGIALSGMEIYRGKKMHEPIQTIAVASTSTKYEVATIGIDVAGALRVIKGSMHWQGEMDRMGIKLPITFQIDQYGVHSITANLIARKPILSDNAQIEAAEVCSSSCTMFVYARKDVDTGEDTVVVRFDESTLNECITNWDKNLREYRHNKVMSFASKYANDPDSFRLMSKPYREALDKFSVAKELHLLDSIPSEAYLEACINHPIHGNKYSHLTDQQKDSCISEVRRQFNELRKYDESIVHNPNMRDSLLSNRQHLLNKLFFVRTDTATTAK